MALGKKKKRKMGRAEPNVEIRQSLKKRKKTRRAIMAGLAVVALLAVVFFIWARAQGRLSVTENAVGSAFTPIVSAVNRSMEWIRDVFRDIGDREALRRENEQLKLDNERLSYQLSQLEAVSGENQRLLSMLDAWDNYETLDPVFARVVARDPGLWFDVFTINAGTSAGVEVNIGNCCAHFLTCGAHYEQCPSEEVFSFDGVAVVECVALLDLEVVCLLDPISVLLKSFLIVVLRFCRIA